MKPHALVLLALAGLLHGQDTTPHIAFVYPAGGQVGTVVEVVAGGQGLGNPKDIQITGSGVTAEVVATLNGNSKLLRDYFKGLRKFHRTGEPDAILQAMDEGNAEKVQNFPGYRELIELEKKAFERVAKKFYTKESKQRNRHLDQRVHLRVTIAPDALPGGA